MALGGLLLAGRGVSAASPIEEQARRTRAVTLWQGNRYSLERRRLLNFTHGGVPAIMYAFVAGPQSGRPWGHEENNPEAVMSVWRDGNIWWFECGQQAGADVEIYYDDFLQVVLQGKTSVFSKAAP